VRTLMAPNTPPDSGTVSVTWPLDTFTPRTGSKRSVTFGPVVRALSVMTSVPMRYSDPLPSAKP